ncbi:hypothetical protein [Streptomyces sp. HNM0574]|uniref:hypothetical protein n=1 Tax=Streptomyces sp. HNM0574 TaxID=2714954 RepID=UPI00146E9485|nr:hypothetical protein [Streptomyces sp. HNM0574]NLU66011.1 hypothetical protein [Streptomyces sp. HNM0574]
MGVLAAALSACSSEPDKRCVDRNSYDYANGYKVVDSSRCKSSSSSGGGAAGGGGSRSGVSKGKSSLGGSDPQWYYDSSKGGGHADSGTFSKSQAVDRGGFGCSGRSGSSGG